jgi:ribonuclease BN (tRNA processing enzyme)
LIDVESRSMKLVLLGTAGYHPNDRRQTACFMIPELGIVLDAGTGMYRVRDRLVTSHLDIFLSHAHLDHVCGLTFLLDVLHGKQMERVTVHGEAQKLSDIKTHLFSNALFPVEPQFELRPLASEVPLPGKGRLTHFPLEHPGGSVGYRLDWHGRSLAYVTDTTAVANASYLQHISGVDLLIHECNFPDSMTDLAQLTGHSCTTPVAETALRAGAKQLVLVHFNALDTSDDPIGIATARAIFPGAQLGEDGMEIEF